MSLDIQWGMIYLRHIFNSVVVSGYLEKHVIILVPLVHI